MDLANLRRFRTIVRHGSLTAAARALGCTQPTLSTAVRRLEDHYGSTLLLRTSRGIEVTVTGQALVEHIDVLFAQLDAIEHHISGLEDGEVGSYVLGCLDSLGAYFLPSFLPRFATEAPGIEVHLWNRSSADVRQAVIEREVHFGLVVNPSPHPDLVMVDLFRDAVDLMVTKAASDRDDAIERLTEGPVLFLERMPQAGAYRRWFDEQGITPARWLRCGELELIKSVVSADYGVGILPRRVAQYGTSGLVRLWPGLPAQPDRIQLLYRVDLHRTRAAMRLKDALVAHGRAMDASFDPS